MEIQYLSIFSTFFTIIFFIFLINKLKQSKSNSKKLPPGPRKLPVIGNLLSTTGPLPHIVFKDLAKKHGPLMHLQLGEISLVIASSSKMAEEVLKTNDLALADKPQLMMSDIILGNCRDFAFAPYGDYWRQTRKICTLEMLNANKVKSFRSIREEEAWDLIETVKNSVGSPINITERAAEMSYNITCRAAIGKKGDKELIKIVEDIAYWGAGLFVSDLFPSIKFLSVITGMKPALQKIRAKIDVIFGKIIREHREKLERRKELGTVVESEEEDLVDVLLRVNETQRLQFPINNNDVQALALDLLAAGTDTSATVLEWAMTMLIKNPRVMKKAQEEVRQVLKEKDKITESDIQGKLTYLKLVLKETLRLHTPLPLLAARECRKECEINGYTIPVKTKVMVNAWAIARDPNFWVDAESFIPERFEDENIDYTGNNFNYLPFGAGRRMCPGVNFGVAGVELSLAQMLFHFDWNLPNDMKPQDLDTEESPGLSSKRKNKLYLVATPYEKRN